ncbi:MAG: CocE/NonD family hydrolase [Chloroflexota bacterium]
MSFNVFNHNDMQIKQEYSHQTEVIERWIPMPDGVQLAARIWLPIDAAQHPVPALLEYLPYRKNDRTLWRDSIRHPYLAGHGYASIRVDIRGNGDSDGLMLDEYSQQELDDALVVMAWLEKQDWCTGSVGIFGKSWGGFNGLQIAALKPPQLKAIITIASTDNRYTDDVHYMGGALLANEMLSWASFMLNYNAAPPDPRFVGEMWREMWQHRLENTPPFVEEWLAHQRYDAYWKHGSVCENYEDIECAVYAVGSWADGYTNAVPRLLQNLSCPKKGLLGPWAHNFPENSSPMPAIGFLQESLRWWDYWLKGIETAVMDEPLLRSWIQHSFPPDTNRKDSAGYWVVDPAWPTPHVASQMIQFEQSGSGKSAIGTNLLCGLDSGPWLTFGESGGFAPDQQGDNGRSLTYTTPSQEKTAVLGHPVAHLTVKVDQPQANLAVRLCDVAPDGSSTLVTYGLLNLSHRNGSEQPEPMPVESAVAVEVPLNLCGHEIAEGHRWQVAVSPSYWPHLWPSPHPVTLTVNSCALELPVRQGHAGDKEIRPFLPPECAEPVKIKPLSAGASTFDITVDRLTQTRRRTIFEDSGSGQFEDGLIFGSSSEDSYELQINDPLSAKVTCRQTQHFSFNDWQVSVKTFSQMTCDAHNFYILNEITTFIGDEQFFNQKWERVIERDYQ